MVPGLGLDNAGVDDPALLQLGMPLSQAVGIADGQGDVVEPGVALVEGAGHGTAVVGNCDGNPSLPVYEQPETGSSFSDSKPNTSTPETAQLSSMTGNP